MRDIFHIHEPGPFTTVQDRGRFDYRHMGVPVSGALDPFACRAANLLVGNSVDCAVLEMTFMGPLIEVLSDADVAVTGAEMPLTINGEPGVGWRSIRVRQGDTVRFGQAKSGCRAYLAVTGGIEVPVVMGSRSTYVNGRLGGVAGRPLRPQDVLKRGDGSLLRKPRSFPRLPAYPSEILLRAIPGPQDDCFGEGLDIFFSSAFTITAQADRMGCRLQGPTIPRRAGAPESIVSEPIVPGNVQVPADGRPIILLVEQTMGGYTKIATVVSPDMERIAQAKPGDTVRFVKTTLEEAHVLYRKWAQYLAALEGVVTAG